MSTATWTAETSRTRAKATQSIPFTILKAIGSLKITVAMFSLGILIILFGTLAQDEMDLASVKREFFNCWVAYVPLDVLFPITLMPHPSPYFGGLGVYFPGGATIGFVLLINLIAAKTTRFSIQAKGTRFILGLVVSLIGAGLITAVIVGGHAASGLQGRPPIEYDTLWGWLKGGFVIVTMALVGYAVMGKMPRFSRILVGVGAVVSFILSAMLLAGGESVRLDDPGLRIVWQLLQASIASCVALAGLWILFGKRGGNVLIHAGVGLLMVGQFVFGDRQIEQRIGLAEGATTNVAIIEDEIEIVLIDTSDEAEDTVYAIPESIIRRVGGTEAILDDDSLPCKVRIQEWMPNSSLEAVTDASKNPATTGFGLQALAKPDKTVGGAVMDDRNMAAAYVELIDKSTDEVIDVVLLTQTINDAAQLSRGGALSDEMKAKLSQDFLMRVGGVGGISDRYEQVEIDSKPFEMAIRFRQQVKPYDVYLKDVERIDYSGTETPRDYSSRIVITDRVTGESQEDKTWMNNPTRYRGETFYQSRYDKLALNDGGSIETTGLQVVENAGWVIPYVCCMMVFWGMFAHFGGTFERFANRYTRGSIASTLPSSSGDSGAATAKSSLWPRVVIATAALAFCGAIAGYFAKPRSYSRSEVDWTEVAKLPVQHEGRIKPFSTVARNVLQRISEPIFGSVPYVRDADENKRLPTEWLLGVMAGEDWVREAQVFRIYSTDVQSFLDLEERPRHRYSYAEIEKNIEKLRAEIQPLRGKDPDTFTFREQKLVALHSKLNLFDLLSLSYMEPPLQIPDRVETEEDQQRLLAQFMRVFELMQNLEAGGPPAMIPPTGEATQESLVDAKWQAYGPARFADLLAPAMGLTEREKNASIDGFASIVAAVNEGDAPEVNKAVRKYEEQLAAMPLAAATQSKAAAENWLNKFDPTAQGVVLYLLAIVMAFGSFMVRYDGLRRATFWILVGVFIIHTIAILSRIYISGRAPVINLYSSAVFIGWACVLLGLVLEVIYPIGIANLVCGLIGVSTISVARFLDTSDTMPVLQAVLDTQFWLSTHVITVTAGYAVTFLAGFIGICALVHRVATGYDSYPPSKRPADAVEFQQIAYRMCYGVICFAIFFSFIGTVLGGLWADDSWGRFWGWDPKENGAMMIVLWNAILLHARWDKQVGERGFAALAVLGNVVTAWSWFGTNQLGIGLHSYGFTSGALIGLVSFVSVNVLFVAVTLMLTKSMAMAAKNSSATSESSSS